MLKKLLASFLIATTLFLSLAPYSLAKAQTNWYDQSFQEWFNKVYDNSNPSEIFGERYTAAQVQWIIYSLFSFIIPEKSTIQCIFSNDIGSCLGEISSALGITDAAINPGVDTKNESLASSIFSPGRPLSFISYIDKLSNKISLVPTVHAQSPGFGFEALQVIQELWVAARNIVYGLIVIIAIVLAFMVMFRMKIAPQVVISIQSAIPKILISLILVTFSYAIAGLLVDLMYVVTGIISLALSSVGNGIFINDPQAMFKFMTTGFISFSNAETGFSVGVFGVLILYLLIFTIIFNAALFTASGGVVGVLATAGLMAGITSLMTVVAFVVMLIVIIFNTFKIWWMLIKAFAQILLLTIVAPFQIAFGTIIPGMGFGSWLKSMAANLAIFPITGLFLILAFLFLIISTRYSLPSDAVFEWWKVLIIPRSNMGTANSIAPNNGWPPLLGGSNAMLGLIFIGASVMVLTLIPKVAEIIKGAISGRPFAYGSAIGEAIGPIKTVGGFAYGQTARPWFEGFMKERGRQKAERIGGDIQNSLQGKQSRGERD